MNKKYKFFVGIDVGSSYIKSVILNKHKKIISWNIRRSGLNFDKNINSCLNDIIKFLGLNNIDLINFVSTGYGRKSVLHSNITRTEIACHAKGCFYNFPFAINIIDIGGQDNKIIKLDKNGKRINFKMNRKCAAGTGSFLEEIATRLNISLKKMNFLAFKSNRAVNFGSYCTVFSATEVLENIKNGAIIENICSGIFHSVIKRVLEMDRFLNNVVLTGGVIAHNPYLLKAAKDLISQKIIVSNFPQFTGALGAALYAYSIE